MVSFGVFNIRGKGLIGLKLFGKLDATNLPLGDGWNLTQLRAIWLYALTYLEMVEIPAICVFFALGIVYWVYHYENWPEITMVVSKENQLQGFFTII